MEETKDKQLWRESFLPQLGQQLREKGLQVEETSGAVHFMVNGLMEHSEWNVAGQCFFVPYAQSHTGEEILQLQLIVAQNVEPALAQVVGSKLAELTGLAMFGRLGLDEKQQVFYMDRIPMVEQESANLLETFEMVLYEMMSFLELFYAYIMVIANEPGKLTLDHYLELTLGDLSTTPDGVAP